MVKYWVGLKIKGYAEQQREVFRCPETPTRESHGHIYDAVIGPFYTKRGAVIMAERGRNNPHIQSVADAEREARREKRGRKEATQDR